MSLTEKEIDNLLLSPDELKVDKQLETDFEKAFELIIANSEFISEKHIVKLNLMLARIWLKKENEFKDLEELEKFLGGKDDFQLSEYDDYF